MIDYEGALSAGEKTPGGLVRAYWFKSRECDCFSDFVWYHAPLWYPIPALSRLSA